MWNKFVKPSGAKGIAIVAHSYGGVVVTDLAQKFREDFESRVFGVAFTDSVHSPAEVTKRLKEVSLIKHFKIFQLSFEIP